MNDRYLVLALYENGRIRTDGFYEKSLAESVAKAIFFGDVIGTMVCKVGTTHIRPGKQWDFIQTAEYEMAFP